ncbi:MAG TPA: hypothetical protein VFT64_05445 [Rickettsiales bacterium]|nr:hypothetical protein [Rickettsiales bacterium]
MDTRKEDKKEIRQNNKMLMALAVILALAALWYIAYVLIGYHTPAAPSP